MENTVTVTFDGSVLKPELALNLEQNECYIITIHAEKEPVNDVWDLLENLAGTVDAPEDWSIEHDHYLYGTPKQHSNQLGHF